MPLHQFRLIGTQVPNNGIRAHAPRLVPFMAQPRWNTGVAQLFYHELAHCIEMMDRGQIQRLSLQNFGWPTNKIGDHRVASANAECRVFAIQYLLEELFIGQPVEHDFLSIYSASLFMGTEKIWVDRMECRRWKAEQSAKDRMEAYMTYYRPNIKKMLDTTVDYMVDNCAEFM